MDDEGPGPAPDGADLHLALDCRPTPATRGRKHPVVVRGDWSVETPHDLDAERVAAAFGGYCSCLAFVDRAVPAFRDALPLLRRVVHGDVRGSGSQWRLPPSVAIEGCCTGRVFASIPRAAVHLRSAEHIALSRRAPLWQVNALLAAAARAWTPWDGPPPESADLVALVREAGGPDELWRAGIHPREVRRLARTVAAVREPLPVSYFVSAAYGDVDHEWIAEVVTRRPDGDTAAWLAGLSAPQSLAPADEWAAWLGFGLARGDVLLAVGSALPPHEVAAVAAATGWAPHVAARNLVAFAAIACRPSADQFRVLAEHGIDHPRPSRGAVDAIRDDVELLALVAGAAGERSWPDRTELAVLLLVHGSRPALLAALHAGLRSTADLPPGRTP